MKRLAILVAPLLLAAGCDKPISPVAPPPKATGENAASFASVGEGASVALNSDNTVITFVGTKPGGKHDGGFKKVDGKIKMNYVSPGTRVNGTPTPISSITVEIDADSLWTDTEKLTNHLKSPDFFDVKQLPKATFASTKIEAVEAKDGTTTVNITGDLTLHGAKKSIAFPASVNTDRGNFVLSSTFKIKWKDFMTFDKAPIDPDVTITIAVGKAPK